MSAFPSTSDAEIASTKRWNHLGYGLITIALFGPSIATKAGLGDFSVGDDFTRTVFSLAFLGLIAWLVVRKKSDLSKARATAVVGVLLCGTVSLNIVNAASENDQAKVFLQQALAFQSQHEEKFADLGQRFDEIRLANYLTPDGLVSSSNIAAGNIALERYRSLLHERNLMLQSYIAECDAFLERLPEGRAKDSAEVGLGQKKEAIEGLYRMLDRVQREHAAAIGAIFNWAIENNGNFAVNNGQLLLTVKQQQELYALANRLDSAEKEVQTVVQEAQTMRTVALQERKEAGALLAK